jgi:hypothetical protein
MTSEAPSRCGRLYRFIMTTAAICCRDLIS